MKDDRACECWKEDGEDGHHLSLCGEPDPSNRFEDSFASQLSGRRLSIRPPSIMVCSMSFSVFDLNSILAFSFLTVRIAMDMNSTDLLTPKLPNRTPPPLL